ncbi:hypothetical protein D3C73_1172890 [compost metagenome]
MNPAMKKGSASIVKYSRFLSKEIPLAPAMIGTAIIKVKSAAARGLIPSKTPPEMVEPEREKPGHRDRHWKAPIVIACL